MGSALGSLMSEGAEQTPSEAIREEGSSSQLAMVVLQANSTFLVPEISLVDLVVVDPLLASLDQAGGVVPAPERIEEANPSVIGELAVVPNGGVGPQQFSLFCCTCFDILNIWYLKILGC